jgi:hypothetical protein
VEPILERVERAASHIENTQLYGGGKSLGYKQGSSMSMLSKMGGRLISFYSDDIADLLIDDILRDAALDLNDIEKKTKKKYKSQEASSFINEMLDNIVSYNNEEHNVELKYRTTPQSFY